MDECDEDSDGNIYEHDESDIMMVLIMMIIRLKRLQDDIIFSVVIYQILYCD